MDKDLSVEVIDDQQLRPIGYIYLTTNLINGKMYIGKHKSSYFNENYKGSGKLLWKAIHKYGWDNFKVELLEWCVSEEQLNLREYEIINELRAVESVRYYNLMPGGHGGYNKTTLSQEDYNEFIRKISESQKKVDRSTPQQVLGRIKASEKMRGHSVSKETRDKMRTSNLGQKRSAEAKKNMSDNHADFSGEKNPFYGKSHSKESRDKIGQASKNREVTTETRRKISESNKGKLSGTTWVNKDGRNRRVKSEYLEDFISQGYTVGFIYRRSC